MNIFLKVIRWIFYILVAAAIVLFIMYKMSDPVNEDYFVCFLYCGSVAICLSALRFILRFMY